MSFYCTIKSKTKNLKFKKEVGITIKSNKTSSKLASYEITGHPLYKLHWLLFVSVHTHLQDLIPTLALVVFVAYNYAAKVGIKFCRCV